MGSLIPAPVARGHKGEMLFTRTYRKRSNASMAAKQPQSQLLTFPTPPELREMIFSYFMALKYDVFGAEWSEGPSVQFHTEIFKINKTIREEATAYLHRTYKFVGLRYFLPNFEDMLLAYHVPVLTSPGRWSAYTKRVLDIDARGHQLEDGEVFAERGVEWAAGRVVMLVSDLPALCEMLRVVAFYTSAKYVYIDTPRERRVSLDSHQGTGFRLKLSFKICPSDFTQFGREAQVSLLQNIRTIKGATIATFEGFTALGENDASVAAEIRPSLVWAQAREWEILAMMLHYKRRADQLVLTKSEEKAHDALRIYTRIMQDHLRVETLAPTPGLVDPTLRHVHEYRRLMRLDLYLYGAQISVRDDMLAEALPLLLTMHGGTLLVNRPSVPTRTKFIFLRLKFDIAILMRIEGLTDDDHLREAMRGTRATAAAHPRDALLESDIELAEELLRPSTSVGAGRDRASKDNLRLRVSVLASPVQVVDSLPAADQLGAPEGLSGWENVLHKAELSKAEKESINKMQRELQLRETVF